MNKLLRGDILVFTNNGLMRLDTIKKEDKILAIDNDNNYYYDEIEEISKVFKKKYKLNKIDNIYLNDNIEVKAIKNIPYNYDIKEFNIGPSRFVVPIQWRGEVLESWRRIVDASIEWKDSLVDIWRIGALSLVAEGRNVAMYRAPRLREHLKDIEFIKFLDCVEQHTNLYISQENLLATSLYIENEDDIQETIDLQSEKSLINIGGLRFDSAELLRLAIASSFFENRIDTVGVFIPLDGKIFALKLPHNIKEISKHILNIALSK